MSLFQRPGNMDIFQKNRIRCRNVFDIPYYNMLRKYLLFLGQDPYQGKRIGMIIVLLMVFSAMSVVVPTLFDIYVSLRGEDIDAVIECMPHLIASATSVVKILNVYLNRENFKKLFDFVTKEWEHLKSNNELYLLEDVTAKGSKVAQLYRHTLLTFFLIFIMGPLLIPMMDIVLPLNETRPRQQAIRVNYLIFDAEKYFFYVYLHLAWSTSVVVLIIITVDSLYILIIHHNCGLFAVCGNQVKKATENWDLLINESSGINAHEHFKCCLIMHDKAIQFYNILNESSRDSYLIQVGLNMMGISVTAVQTVLNLNRPEEAIRTAAFLGGEQFHLFMISLPGQVLLDHSFELRDNIYSSHWYKIPVKIQKMIHTMQIRSEKPCALTAGGLYEMNMENFANTFKMCMSYFTMLMSLRD